MNDEIAAPVFMLGADGLLCRPKEGELMDVKCKLGDAGFTIMYVNDFAVGLSGERELYKEVLGVELRDPPDGTYVCAPTTPALQKYSLGMEIRRRYTSHYY